MIRTARVVRVSALFAVLLLASAASRAQAPAADGSVLRVPLDTLEAFALADDRAAVLETLLPGTLDHFYYSALLAQHEGRLDEVPALLDTWVERLGRSELSERVRLRQMVLMYARDPRLSFDALSKELDLRFDHAPDLPGRSPDLPTRLDASVLSREAVIALALERGRSGIAMLSQAALVQHIAAGLDDTDLDVALRELEVNAVPELPALLVRHLRSRFRPRFGSLRIHGELTLGQLERCAELAPELLADTDYVNAVLKRLAPPDGVDLERDADAQLAYLDRLETFVERLPVVHNSLRARVLHARLVHDRGRGVVDRARFLRYLALPRAGAIRVAKSYEGYRPETGLVQGGNDYRLDVPQLGDDTPLVRAYLEHLLRDADDWSAFSGVLREAWLRRVFAETKILHGVGDMQRWSALLDDPEAWREIEERVELEFAPTQTTRFAADDTVVFELDVKNVPRLLVRVFELDAFTVHSELGREIDADLDLDGLVPNHSETHDFADSPLRRVRRRFELPQLRQPGAYVVDFVGNGHASRALVRKGRLTRVERSSAGGHVLRVYDERAQLVRGASAWLDGRQFEADDAGDILIPFTTEPGRRTLLLRHGALSERVSFEHAAETYALELGGHVLRESLLEDGKAPLLLRPSLTLNGEPLSLELLEDPRLEVRARSHDGVESALDVPDLELSDRGELVQEIEVPDDLATLTLKLHGSLRNLSAGRDETLSSEPLQFHLNVMRATTAVRAPVLVRDAQGYALDVLGRTGEPLADVPVRLDVSHRDIEKEITVTLKTDARGRVHLGALPGVWRIRERLTGSGNDVWDLRLDDRNLPGSITGGVGDTLRIPVISMFEEVGHLLSLVELRGTTPAFDRSSHASLEDGFLVLRDLPPGSFRLELPAQEPDTRAMRTHIRIVDGPLRDGRYFGAESVLPRTGRGMLHVQRAEVVGDALEIQLANAGPDARVHLLPSRYVPTYDAYAGLAARAVRSDRSATRPWSAASLHTGATLSDEQRYILERRLAQVFPGNMLSRPSLLLNPLALEEVTSQTLFGRGGGGKLGRRGASSRGFDLRASESRLPTLGAGTAGLYTDFDFLAHRALPLANLRPADDGRLRIPLALFGDASLVQVVALDADDSVTRAVPLTESPLEPRDRGLRNALPPDSHAQQQRRLEFVDAGTALAIRDPATTRFQLVDSLAAVFTLFRGLSDDARLDDFAFLLTWPEMTRDERLAAYSEHACHELHVFLHEKDRAFFDEVVRPFLANKLQKTFLDHWLLDADLSGYLAPEAFARLNTAERVLLGRRLGEPRRAGVARHVADRVALSPLTPAQERRLFETLLRGSALESSALGAEFREAAKLARSLEAALEPPSNPAGATREDLGRALAELGYIGDEEVAALDDPVVSDAAIRSRGESLAFYRAPDATRRLVEHNYWQLRREQQTAALIQPDAFWLDLANTPEGAPFRSTHVAEAAGNVAEMMLALAFLELPFAPSTHTLESADTGLTLGVGGPALLVLEELGPAAAPPADAPILVSQDVLPRTPRAPDEPLPDTLEQLVRGEAYLLQVVVSNPGAAPRDLELLVQLPSGAVPLEGARATQVLDLRLQPYSTERVTLSFYLPRAGASTLFPVHVSQEGELLAAGAPRRFEVLAEAPQLDVTSWSHVSQAGTLDELLTYLDGANLFELDLGALAWRMGDRAQYDAILAALRARNVYAHGLWSYALRHGDAATAAEYLAHDGAFTRRLGETLVSELLTLDPVARQRHEHVEFDPLHNARAHLLGGRPQIPLAALTQQYELERQRLALKPRLDDADWLVVAYDLLLQDRLEEGLAAFARVRRDAVSSKLQYDAVQAWLAFSTEDHELARRLAEAHADEPVLHWRERFRQVLAQLDEAAGDAVAVVDPDDRDQSQTQRAAAGPSLELQLEGRSATLRSENLAEVEVNYYAMDVESLFSSSPFAALDGGGFALIRPNRSERVTLDASGVTRFELPAEYQRRHVLVELRAGGLVRRATSMSNQLAVQMLTDYGQLQVRHAESGAPLSKVYVKVYAESPDGTTRFHKDGYTDLRGRFDYVSLSATDFEPPTRFAVLVLSDEHGALIREVAPPAR